MYTVAWAFIANCEILIAHFCELISLNRTPQIIIAQGYSLLMDEILCVKKLRSWVTLQKGPVPIPYMYYSIK